jgi:nitroimidazol reductase NimA-like FMN-containing flavoprotein (pyridoxamine 5'-phosphate oxidase superfamily)
MKELSPTPRSTIRRSPDRARTERRLLHEILDEGLVCHVGFSIDGEPFVIPTNYARWGETLVLHGSPASRMLRALAGGAPACVAVTLVDGLVLARSAFHHSMNYRSAILFGVAREITDREEKQAALRAIVEHVVPGRSRDVRGPSPTEIAQTLVLALPLDEASVKVRSGPPRDDEEDLSLGCWAGVIPLQILPSAPVDDLTLAEGIAPPESVTGWRRPR